MEPNEGSHEARSEEGGRGRSELTGTGAAVDEEATNAAGRDGAGSEDLPGPVARDVNDSDKITAATGNGGGTSGNGMRWPEAPFFYTLSLGALGGALSYLWPQGGTHPFLTHLALGAGAAIVFVYLLANTDRRNVERLAAVSLVAGFAWGIVWDNAVSSVVGDKDTSPDRLEDVAVRQIESTQRIRTQIAGDPESPSVCAYSIESSDTRRDAILASEYSICIDVAADSANVTIEVDAANDLVATLHVLQGGIPRVVAYSDDSDYSLNPYIHETLARGDYLLSLLPFDSDQAVGELEIAIEINSVSGS